ncbi:MAG: lipoprotein-releasing ABC transporter permease subunit [Desulfobacteraceae bacterium]
MSFEFFLARRYLRAKRKEGFISLITFLSVAGVAVGVMALVIVISVMSGAETNFREKILGLEPHLLVMNYAGKFDEYKDIKNRIGKMDRVTNVSPLVFSQAMIRAGKSFSGVMLRGIDPETKTSLIQGFSSSELKKVLNKGVSGSKAPGIVLGRELARKIGADKGDGIILVSPSGLISPVGHVPSMRRFKVTGTFSSGMYEYDSAIAYVHIDEALRHEGGKGISALGIWIDDVFKTKSFSEKNLSFLEPPFYVNDWMDINKSLFSALKLEKTAMFIILTLIILVAAFNIASALIMMVMEKTRDIAVLKAMGATNRVIRKIFMIKGMIIGLSGTLLGTFLGVGVCVLLTRYKFIHLPEAYPFSTLPVQLNAVDVTVIAASAMLICFFSTIYPAVKASKMNPVEALRYG